MNTEVEARDWRKILNTKSNQVLIILENRLLLQQNGDSELEDPGKDERGFN